MKIPMTAERYLRGFQLLVLIGSFLLGLDQLFISWRNAGATQVVSVIGFLPQSLIDNHQVFQLITVVFLLATLLWVFKIQPRVTSLLAAISFILSTSWYLQNEPFGDHRQSVFSFLLILLTLNEWGIFKDSLFRIAGVLVVSFYFLAGWEKVYYSGLAWPNGTGLQIFVHYMGYAHSRIGALILNHHALAVSAQWSILIVECGAFFLFGPRPVRWLWLILLLGFHIGIEEIFGYRYFLHYLLVIYLFALPDFMEKQHAGKA